MEDAWRPFDKADKHGVDVEAATEVSETLVWLLFPRLVRCAVRQVAKRRTSAYLERELKELAEVFVGIRKRERKTLGEGAADRAVASYLAWVCSRVQLKRVRAALKPLAHRRYRGRAAATLAYRDTLLPHAPSAQADRYATALVEMSPLGMWTTLPGNAAAVCIAMSFRRSPETVSEKWPAALKRLLRMRELLESKPMKERFVNECRHALEFLRAQEKRSYLRKAALANLLYKGSVGSGFD